MKPHTKGRKGPDKRAARPKPRKPAPGPKPHKPAKKKTVAPDPRIPMERIPEEASSMDDVPKEGGLTYRMRAFVEYYLGPARLNATKAARMAGYGDGSDHSLCQAGYRTLTNSDVQSRVRARLAELKVTREDILSRIGMLAGSSLADVLGPDEDGKIRLDMNKAAEAGALGLLREYEEIDMGEAGIKRKVKAHDPGRYLEMLAEHTGLIKGKGVQIGMPGGGGQGPGDAEAMTPQQILEYLQENKMDVPDELAKKVAQATAQAPAAEPAK